MGFNTTVLVMNDAIGRIQLDTKFGEKLAAAIMALGVKGDNIDISSGGHANAATVVETHHADDAAIVAIGGNCATVLDHSPSCNHTEESGQLRILRELASKYGFDLVEKKEKKKRK